MFSKLNTGASYSFQQNGNTGLGMVIRDPTGVVVGSKVIKGLSHMEVERAEAIAIREGLIFALSLNFKKLLVESDSLSIINKINKDSLDLSYLGLIIKEIQQLRSSFTSVSFSFIPKQANLVAHHLIKFSFSLILDVSSWIGCVSPPVEELVFADSVVS